MERPVANGLGIYLDKGVLNWLLTERTFADRLLERTLRGVVRPVIDPTDIADISEAEGQANKDFLNAFLVKAVWAGAAIPFEASGFTYASRGTVWKVPRDAEETLLWSRLLAIRGVPTEAPPRLVVARHQSCRHFVTQRWAHLQPALSTSIPDLGFALLTPEAVASVIP